MTWATPDDVCRLTGAEVEQEDVERAQGIIELVTGNRFEALTVDNTSPGIFDWLRRAAAYQTAFMTDHPDFFTRMDVSSFSQDGLSANLKEDSQVLSPLARRCLLKVTGGTRSVETGSPNVVRPWYTSDDVDDSLPWKPLA